MSFTPRQQAIVDCVRDFWSREKHGPTFQEIGAEVGLSSTSSVAHQVKTLRRLGVLTGGELFRTLRLATTHPCPVCRGTGIDPNEEAA